MEKNSQKTKSTTSLSGVNGTLSVPIVAVLGHVDHGKTSLLDRIRNTNVIAREAGGITQSIGAWQIEIPRTKGARDDFARKITFIDTPGHEAFQAMRARGAKVADLAILVIAADDGIMPQTKQSIEFIRESKTPFLVVITKIDLPTAQIDKVKNQLLELEIVPEDYGGETVVIPVSAKTGQGIEDLLEMISLMAELNNVSGSLSGNLEAYIIEAERDARRGVVVSTVLKNGTIKIGDFLNAEGVGGKARGLFDQNGIPIKEAGPGDPVEIIGLSALPAVGSLVTHKGSGTEVAKEEKREIPKTEGFPIILKADTAGSLEAILGQLSSEVGILLSGVGEIIESDILVAAPQKAVVVGFNVKAGKDVLKLAEEEKVLVYTYKIIYELASDVDKWQKEKAEELREKILGRAEVIAQFSHGKTRIAGCKLLAGRITKSDKVRLVREEQSLGNVKLESLKKQKSEVGKVDQIGEEFGTYFEPQFDFRTGDVIESYL